MGPILKPDKDFGEVERLWTQLMESVEANRLEVWGRWQHFKGGEYRIVAISLLESDYTRLVTYQSITHGTVWTRPLTEFLAKFKRAD